MYIRKRLAETMITLIVRLSTVKRLSKTCFRGPLLPLAGNFLLWSSVEEVFGDLGVLAQFLDELGERLLIQDIGTHSVCITHSTSVGWESTAPRENYSDDDLEQFPLNRKSVALRVKPTCLHLLAPRTRQLTIVYEFKFEGEFPVAVIHSIYPGKDIGELCGDVTAREGRIFFDWDHPGE